MNDTLASTTTRQAIMAAVAVLGATVVWSSTLPALRYDALMQAASTNVYNLTHTPVFSLVASAFVATDVTAVVVVAGLAVALWVGVRHIAAGMLALGAVVGHVLGSLTTAAVVAVGVSRHWLPSSEWSISGDVGPSYLLFGVLGVLMAGWPTVTGRLTSVAVATVALFAWGVPMFFEVAFLGHIVAAIWGAGTWWCATAFSRHLRDVEVRPVCAT